MQSQKFFLAIGLLGVFLLSSCFTRETEDIHAEINDEITNDRLYDEQCAVVSVINMIRNAKIRKSTGETQKFVAASVNEFEANSVVYTRNGRDIGINFAVFDFISVDSDGDAVNGSLGYREPVDVSVFWNLILLNRWAQIGEIPRFDFWLDNIRVSRNSGFFFSPVAEERRCDSFYLFELYNVRDSQYLRGRNSKGEEFILSAGMSSPFTKTLRRPARKKGKTARRKGRKKRLEQSAATGAEGEELFVVEEHIPLLSDSERKQLEKPDEVAEAEILLNTLRARKRLAQSMIQLIRQQASSFSWSLNMVKKGALNDDRTISLQEARSLVSDAVDGLDDRQKSYLKSDEYSQVLLKKLPLVIRASGNRMLAFEE